MSQTGDVIYVDEQGMDMEFGDGNLTLIIPVVNEDAITDYPVTIRWSISAGTNTVASDAIQSRVGPNRTREYEVEIEHQLPDGTDLFTCANAQIEFQNPGGL